jgi:hypothetical protein
MHTFSHRYGRTADLNYLTFRGVDLQPDSPHLWSSIFSFDHSGDQSLTQGNKGSCGRWLSLFYHYRKDVEYGGWLKKGDRPVVYLNTQVRNSESLLRFSVTFPFSM